jgi:M penetrans paralogue family 26
MEVTSNPIDTQNLGGTGSQKLPNATTVLVLGILSIPLCCCIDGIVGLTLGIIALVLAKKDLTLFETNPGMYDPKSLSNLKGGRICAIIGVVFSSLMIIFAIFLIATIGLSALSDPAAMKEWIESMR